MGKSPGQVSPKAYWAALQKSKLTPNFWMTEEYADLKGLVWRRKKGLWGWCEVRQPGWFLPPIEPGKGFRIDVDVWAGFLGEHSMDHQFLDHQYIYDARKFLDLSGGQWKVYRRNVRKYPARTEGELHYLRLKGPKFYVDNIGEMILKWAEGKTIQDPETMCRFFMEGSLRWGLFHNGKLVGINVGDQNHAHGIYRYCVDDGSPFLNEYLRHCFYTSDWAQEKRWINDGGDLGNPALARFKEKLNPAIIDRVYSYQSR